MMTQPVENGLPVEHLTGFDCLRCGHAAIAHYRAPSCRNCRCSADPVCWCGRLASRHTSTAETCWCDGPDCGQTPCVETQGSTRVIPPGSGA